MTNRLLRPHERNDGKPWVPWKAGSEYLLTLPGHRERICLEAWFDRDRQSIILTVTQYDETMTRYEPCWAQLTWNEVGPLFGVADIEDAGLFWASVVAETFGCLAVEQDAQGQHDPGPFD
jgi:hypothetical protein